MYFVKNENQFSSLKEFYDILPKPVQDQIEKIEYGSLEILHVSAKTKNESRVFMPESLDIYNISFDYENQILIIYGKISVPSVTYKRDVRFNFKNIQNYSIEFVRR